MTAVLKKGEILSYGIDKTAFKGMTIARKNEIKVDHIKTIKDYVETYNDFEDGIQL